MINSVRNSVLSILNKNNYGYISPSDFNLYAKNSQLEIYEEYFSDYNKTINQQNIRASGVDYADVERPISESLEAFLRTDFLSKKTTNTFYKPSFTSTGYEAYMLLEVKCNPVALKTGEITALASNRLIDSTANFISSGISSGDIVSNLNTGNISTVISVISDTIISLDSNIFLFEGNSYSIFSNLNWVQSEKVIWSKTSLLINSNLTKPSAQHPIYTMRGNELICYPVTINSKGQVMATYFRYPKAPKWTYIIFSDGEPVFDQSQSDYQDFELPSQDEYKLVSKILEYCGVSIREKDVVQFGNEQEAKV